MAPIAKLSYPNASLDHNMTAAFDRVQHVEGHVLLSLSLLNAKPGRVIPENFVTLSLISYILEAKFLFCLLMDQMPIYSSISIRLLFHVQLLDDAL